MDRLPEPSEGKSGAEGGNGSRDKKVSRKSSQI